MKSLKMNQFKSIAFSGLIALAFATTSCSNNIKKMSTANSSHVCDTKCEDHSLKMQTVSFKKGKVYELAFADIRPEKMDQLNSEYFPKAMPLMAKYGAKMIGGFGVVKNESSLLPSNMVAIFEWPTVEARLKLLADAEFKKIVYLRDEALKEVNLGYFEVAESKDITFRSDKVYEFGSADLNTDKKSKASLQKYFEVSEPIKRNYGGTYPEFILNLSAVDSKDQATYVPHMQFIVEWDSLEDNEKLFANVDFDTKAKPLLMKAISKADFVFTKFSFNQ